MTRLRLPLIPLLLLPGPLLAQEVIEAVPVEAAPVEPQPGEAGAVAPDEPGSELWQLAMTHYERQDWRNAYERFMLYLERVPQAPNAAWARFRLGECARRLGNLGRARQLYEQTIRLHGPGEPLAASEPAAAAAFQLAVMHYLNDSFEGAVPLFLLAREQTSREAVVVESNFLLAISQNQLGNEAAEREAWEALLAVETEAGGPPNHAANAHLGLAKLLRVRADKLAAEGEVETETGADEATGETDPEGEAGTGESPAGELGPEPTTARIEELRAEALAHLEVIIAGNVPTTPAQIAAAKNQRALLRLRADQFDQAIEDFQAVLTTPDAGPEDRVTARFGLMDAAYGQQRWDDVVSAYRGEEMPADPALQARMHLLGGNALLRLDRLDAAREAYRAAQFIDPIGPSGSEAGYRELLVASRTRDSQLVVLAEEFIESQNRMPESPWSDRARLIVGEFFMAGGNHATAADWFGRIGDESSLYPELRDNYLFKLGWLQIRLRQYNNALATLGRFLDQYPDSEKAAEATVLRAHSAWKLGNLEVAETGFKTVIDNHPGTVAAESAWNQLAQLYVAESNAEGVIEAYGGLLEHFPETDSAAEAHARLGQAYQQLGEHARAIEYLRTSAELEPAREMLAMSLIIPSYRALEDPVGAAAAVDRALELNANLPAARDALIWLGARFYQRENYDRAAHYLSIVDEDRLAASRRRLLHLYLGRALDRLGRYEEAVIGFSNYLALEENPVQRAQALAERGRSHLALDQFDEATADARTGLGLVQEGRTSADLSLLLGEIALSQQDWEAAAQALVRPGITFADPTITPQALSGLLQAAEARGEDEKAADYRHRLQESYPRWQPETRPVPVPRPEDSTIQLIPVARNQSAPEGDEAEAGKGEAEESGESEDAAEGEDTGEEAENRADDGDSEDSAGEDNNSDE